MTGGPRHGTKNHVNDRRAPERSAVPQGCMMLKYTLPAPGPGVFCEVFPPQTRKKLCKFHGRFLENPALQHSVLANQFVDDAYPTSRNNVFETVFVFPLTKVGLRFFHSILPYCRLLLRTASCPNVGFYDIVCTMYFHV